MRLRTRFQINTLASLAAIVAMGLILAWSLWESRRARGAENLAIILQQEILECGIVRDSYLLYGEEGAKMQRASKSARIRALLQQGEDRFQGEAERQTLREMGSLSDRADALFAEVVRSHDQAARDESRRKVSLAFQERATSRMLLLSYEVYSRVKRLAQSAAERADATQHRTVLLVFVMIGAALAITVVSAVTTGRLVERRVIRLRDGAGRVAAGELTYRLNIAGNDELAELGTAFDTMTARLQRDVSERKVIEQQIREANRLKSEFLANMSHELRTPLNAIIGFAELIHRGKAGAVPVEQHEYLGDILTSSRHLLQLINDVLDLAKVESGKMEFRPQTIDVAMLVGEVRDILRGLAAGKRLTVETQVDPEVRTATVDPARLKQVLYNYLSNAIKFTPDEGRMTIRVSPQGSDFFRLDVEDTGIGVRPADIQRLFVEFQQLDASAAKKYQGTGLGLAMTKRIVEAQGGRVEVRSSPGQGSTFSAILPRAMPVAEEPAPPPLPAPAPQVPTVLVIEDDPRESDWLADTIRKAGYAVEAVLTGAEAIELSRRRRFSAITLDILLPDLSGWDVLREIRSKSLNEDVPIIAVTLSAQQVKGFELHDYLIKPVSDEVLVASLRRANIDAAANRSVLVIDDDPAALKLAGATLREAGYRSVCMPSAEEALKAVEEHPPAAVVLDLLLPGMDGFQFLSHFRETPAGRSVPIIIWTVKDVTLAEQERLRASAQGIASKSGGGADALMEQLRPFLTSPGETAGGR
jgi:signal transduction histidine kinase/DNA-binding response OmpR family regulator